MRKLLTGLILSLGLAGFAQAQSDDGLLPVEQAFKLTTRAAEPGKIALHWEIAKDYYLYRSRI